MVVGSAEETLRHELVLTDCRWVVEAPTGDVEAKIRSASTLRPAVYSDGLLTFPEGVTAAARGQSAVLYRDDEVLGGGIISEAR